MNKIYFYGGIGVVIVIIGVILLLHLESNNSNNPFVTPVYPLTVTILDSRPNDIHVGDTFALDASITNPNFHIDIPYSNISVTTTFVPNTIYDYHYDCSGIASSPLLYYGNTTEAIPYLHCGNKTFVANSAGEINATVNIQYNIDGKTYNMTASKMFTILPISTIQKESGTMNVTGTNYLVNYTITNGKILGMAWDTSFKSLDIDIKPVDTGILNIQMPRELDNSDVHNFNFHTFINGYGFFQQPSTMSDNRTLSLTFSNNTDLIQIYLSKYR